MKKFAVLMMILFALYGCAWGAELRPGEEEFNKAWGLHQEKKYAEAFTEFQKSAEKGFHNGATWVGLYYFGDFSVEKDTDRAVEFIKRGADLGSPMGLIDIGLIYTFGYWGTEAYKNIPLGVEYIEKAIAIDSPIPGAFYQMGRLYEEGIGKEKDTQKALEMYERAASLADFPAAQEAIGRIKNPSIPAQALMTEAEQNILKFDKNYKGKQLTVNGYVGEIQEDSMNKGYRLRLQPRPGQGTWIGCMFSQENADILADLEYKAPIKIRGMYQGKQQMQIEDIVLLDCEVVK